MPMHEIKILKEYSLKKTLKIFKIPKRQLTSRKGILILDR